MKHRVTNYLVIFAIFLVTCQEEEPLPPIADAGEAISTVTLTMVTLNGSHSRSQIQGDSLKFSWSILEAPLGSKASIVNPNSERPLLTPDLSGRYFIMLEVVDGKNQIGRDSVLVYAQKPSLSFDTGGSRRPGEHVIFKISCLTCHFTEAKLLKIDFRSAMDTISVNSIQVINNLYLDIEFDIPLGIEDSWYNINISSDVDNFTLYEINGGLRVVVPSIVEVSPWFTLRNETIQMEVSFENIIMTEISSLQLVHGSYSIEANFVKGISPGGYIGKIDTYTRCIWQAEMTIPSDAPIGYYAVMVNGKELDYFPGPIVKENAVLIHANSFSVSSILPKTVYSGVDTDFVLTCKGTHFLTANDIQVSLINDQSESSIKLDLANIVNDSTLLLKLNQHPPWFGPQPNGYILYPNSTYTLKIFTDVDGLVFLDNAVTAEIKTSFEFSDPNPRLDCDGAAHKISIIGTGTHFKSASEIIFPDAYYTTSFEVVSYTIFDEGTVDLYIKCTPQGINHDVFYITFAIWNNVDGFIPGNGKIQAR